MTKALFTAAMAALLVGCAPLSVREVKFPVPVPCIDQAPALAAVPLESTTRAEAAALGQTGNWAALADCVAATLRILAADRARLQAAVAGCAALSKGDPVKTR